MGSPSARDVGRLVLRTAMGGILFVHGAQKLYRPWMRNIALASVVPAAAVVVWRRRQALTAATQGDLLVAEPEVAADA